MTIIFFLFEIKASYLKAYFLIKTRIYLKIARDREHTIERGKLGNC